MEIYKELNNPLSKEFEQLLNNQLSKANIEEGKIISTYLFDNVCQCVHSYRYIGITCHQTYMFRHCGI